MNVQDEMKQLKEIYQIDLPTTKQDEVSVKSIPVLVPAPTYDQFNQVFSLRNCDKIINLLNLCRFSTLFYCHYYNTLREEILVKQIN